MAKDELWSPTTLDGEHQHELALTQVDLTRQTAKSLESCARFICILKILHAKQQGLPRVPIKRDGFLAPFVHGRYFLQMFPNLPLAHSIWIAEEKLNIFTESYPLTLSHFRGASGIKNPLDRLARDSVALDFIFHELAQGVNYIHSIGIMHLDLKPANILLTADRHCIISDFSCSLLDQTVKRKETQEVPFPTYRTRDPPTACFSAPELVERQPFSARADMWSLGMIMFDLVCPEYLPLILGDQAIPEPSHYYQMLNTMDLKVQMMRNRVPHSISNFILSLCVIDPASRKASKHIIKALRKKRWSDRSTFDAPSPLHQYAPRRGKLTCPSLDAAPSEPTNILFELSTSEAINRLRKRVYSLCEFELGWYSL